MTSRERPVMLLPAPTDPADPSVIRWRVGPGLVRMDGEVPATQLPGELRALVDAGVLEAVRVQPGRVDTRLAAGHDPRTDGSAVRDALFTVLSRPGGWPVADVTPAVAATAPSGSTSTTRCRPGPTPNWPTACGRCWPVSSAATPLHTAAGWNWSTWSAGW
nr:hypothetical protein [Gordonia sp. NB41Y]KOY49272.1 hypothetical protein ISGA_11195 [Gordonia sp. NB41Y]